MFWLGVARPRVAHSSAASGVVRYSTSACAAGLSLNMTTKSPAPMTAGAEPSMAGKVKTLYPSSGSSVVSTEAGTKSPSMTIAASGSSVSTLEIEPGLSVWSAPCGTAGDVVRVAVDLGHLRERVLHGLVGPRDLVRRELVVLLDARGADVDVLEQVGEGPAVRAGERVRRQARVP